METIRLLAIPGLLLVSVPSGATPLAPGATLSLSGESQALHPEWGGVIANDQVHAFSIENGSGVTLLEGNLQDRNIDSNVDGDMVFGQRLKDLVSPSGTGRVVEVILRGYGGVEIDAEYSRSSSGVAPASIDRSSGTGDVLTVSYGAGAVVPPDVPRPVQVVTNAPGCALSGSVTIVAEDGPGGPRFSTTIDGTIAPVYFDRSTVPVLSFGKEGSSFVLRFHAQARTFYQLWTAPTPEGPWTERFAIFKVLTPAEMSFRSYEPVEGREFFKLETADP